MVKMERDEIIMLIEEYIGQFSTGLSEKMKKKDKYFLLYSISSCKDILEEIMNNPSVPCSYILENKCNEYSRLACMNPHTTHAFSVAYDVAIYIYDIIQCSYTERR